MKKRTMLSVLVAAMIVSPMGLTMAHASPTAPRAKVVAPQAAEAPAAPQGPCLNIDGDNRVVCLFNGDPGANCKEILGLGRLVNYYRCGDPSPKPPVPVGCANLNGDNDFTCLGGSEPNGQCASTFDILIIHGYHCTRGGRIIGR